MLFADCSQVTRTEQVDRGEKVDAGAFLHEHLQQEATVTVGEAYRAIIMLSDGDDQFQSFEQREASLLNRGFIRPAWKLQREQAIDHGSVAYMIVKILKIRGGINLEVLGRMGIGDRRYALRELIYLRMLPTAPAYRYMTGSELVDLIGKADAYMTKHGLYPEPSTDIGQVLESQVNPTTQPASK